MVIARPHKTVSAIVVWLLIECKFIDRATERHAVEEFFKTSKSEQKSKRWYKKVQWGSLIKAVQSSEELSYSLSFYK